MRIVVNEADHLPVFQVVEVHEAGAEWYASVRHAWFWPRTVEGVASAIREPGMVDPSPAVKHCISLDVDQLVLLKSKKESVHETLVVPPTSQMVGQWRGRVPPPVLDDEFAGRPAKRAITAPALSAVQQLGEEMAFVLIHA